MRFLPIVWRNLLRRKFRTFFTMGAIFFACLLFGVLMAIKSAFGNFIDFGLRAFSNAVGMIATLPNTNGGDVFIKCPMEGLKFASFSTCSVRSTMPLLPNAGSVCPVFASSAINS